MIVAVGGGDGGGGGSLIDECRSLLLDLFRTRECSGAHGVEYNDDLHCKPPPQK